MKKVKLLLLLFITVIAAFSINKVVSDNKKANLRKQRAEINYRIDNMGYWTSLAEKGIIPYNPDVQPEPAIFKGTKINAFSVRSGDSPDVPVAGPSTSQSENSVVVDPTNDSIIFNSNNSLSASGNTLYGADYLYSFDIAETWEGSYMAPNGQNYGDPAVAIDNLGRWYVGYISSAGGQRVSYSDNHGQTWSYSNVANKPGSGWYDMCDKNHLWIDTKPGSPYENYVYDAWTDFGGQYNYEVVFKRSTDRGQTWGPKIALSPDVNAGSHNQGVNLATGPNGEVYAAWAIYDYSSNLTEKAIGFCKSTDGGASFSNAVRAINGIYGIRNIGVPQNMRVNSFPVMAVDISDCVYSGNIYIVWANRGVPGVNSGTDVDIYMLRSTNGGLSWDDPIRVNQDPVGQGKKHYLPWITVDPVTGAISVVFYDNRNTTYPNKAEAWVAVSTNAGETWEDFRVSDVEFTPSGIPGAADDYFGDYLGISAYNGKVFPVWTDNRTGKAMTYVSPFENIMANAPYDLVADANEETGVIHLTWSHEQCSGFEYYKIFKDSVFLDTSVNPEYYDTLQDYAYLQYSVKAVYKEDTESMSASVKTQYGTSVAKFIPDTLITVVDVTDTTASSHIKVTNEGTLYLVYSYNPIGKQQFNMPDYQPAIGGGDEYIRRVKIAGLDNFTPPENYRDFSDLPISVDRGKTYEIMVESGNSYIGDQCAVWVDWNGNGDFEKEPVKLRPDDSYKRFNGKIKILEGFAHEYYKMRVRLTGPDDKMSAYGDTEYGEVEDYMFVPGSWLTFSPLSDTVQVNDTSIITFNFNSEGMEPGVYAQDINFAVTDLDTNMKTVHVVMKLTTLTVDASSDTAVCSGSKIQLFADATGGLGNLTYQWTTLGGVFVSDEQNPMITVDSTESYVVAVYDTVMVVKYDTVSVTAYALPVVDLGSDTAFCGQTDTASIVLDAGTDGVSYLWSTGDTTQTVKLNKEKLGAYGEYTISVEVTNENGCSSTDEVLVNMKDCTSIREHSDNLSAGTFPNPSDGSFILTLNAKHNESVNVRIVSMTGAVVYVANDIYVNGKTTRRINLENAGSGVYTIIIEGEDSFTTQKIVVTR
jgi:hypothetical protein